MQSVPPVERIAVRNAWARIADSGATSGAYLDVVNNDSALLRLIGVSTDDAYAAEVHETMQHDGMARMMPRSEIAIAPGTALTMAPGGLHIMLIGVHRTLAAGDSVRVRLRFSDSSAVTTVIPVKTP